MPAATTITNAMLSSLRGHIVSIAAYGQYKIADTWHRGKIETAEVRANGSVLVTFYVEPADAALTPATAFRLCAEDGTVLAEREETLAFTQNQADAIMYRFKFGVRVGEDAA